MEFKFVLKKLGLIAAFVLVWHVSGQHLYAQRVTEPRDARIHISYCNLDVSTFWKRANANFYLMYSFKIDSGGNVTDLKKIRDEVVGIDNVRKCMETWKLIGFPESNIYVANFKWRHGRGWVEMALSGKGFKQTVLIDEVGY